MSSQMASLIAPNRIEWSGETKMVAAFGKSADGFWMKRDLQDIAESLGVKDVYGMTRAQLASSLLCMIKDRPDKKFVYGESNAEKTSNEFLEWFDAKNKEDEYPPASWTPLGKNHHHAHWFQTNIQTSFDFSMYMYGVIIGQLPSPLCDFQRDDDLIEKPLRLNKDNAWWGGKAHALLVKMNETLLFTSLDSRTISAKGNEEKCMINPTEALAKSVFNNRAYLVGIMPEKKADDFVRDMNMRGFVCWRTGMQKPDDKDLHRVTKSISDFHIEMKSCDKLVRLNDGELYSKLRESHVYVNLFDPKNHRPAEDEDGLFTVALCELTHACGDQDA